ncbi:hypothetical protein J4E90_010559 [Alternaria incomplexa]|uniref:uncharacterized protein n=1 Tax=Alternaria incomplexa TaxID=1187928 RepID=UPI002220372F|nr:uncharacterized protein J4E90_010559 [Alternaria incomplexa]KAI4906485.1 hypothetical protein J4E90_010559 [Alternaria incomplexa]
MDEFPPCQVALDYLEINEIKALFEDEPYGLTTERLYLCPCSRCTRDGGSREYRSDCFKERRKQQELRGDYALIYALLISIRRPGLIHMFQKYELKLDGTRYFRDADFDDLRHRETVLDLETVQRKILEQQYNFLVRTLRPAPDVVFIPTKELLPIKEDTELKGEGTLAEVRCFEFQDDDYRSEDFGPHIKRFARKIFRHGMGKAVAKEWYNLQRLSKEENHPHLMVALGAYWHGSHFFILQEEADGSLHDYLKGPGDVFDFRELWAQMQGVVEGLNTLHKLYKGTRIEYHQNLKPANILIVKGTMKIADFGLIELKAATLAADADPTDVPNEHNTGYYAAPRRGGYTRECDIWSLGCIMSEVATCDIQGRDGVSHYKKARMADGPSGKDTPRFSYGRKVKDAVIFMHKQLYASVQSSTPTDGNPTRQLQKRFYNERFFDLLNKMFWWGRASADLPEVSDKGIGLDAAHVIETLQKLRKEILPSLPLETLPCELVIGAPVDWSGRGTSHVDYKIDERVPLVEGRFLGHGVHGGVYETEIGSNGIRLAWKRKYARRKIGQSERREIEIIKRLSHAHIIRLIGTYTRGLVLGLLLWPVATCDLATLLVDADWLQKRTTDGDWEDSDALVSVYSEDYDHDREPAFVSLSLTGNDGQQTLKSTIAYLWKTIGCIASAVSYLHSSGIKHKDLKPSNVVLSANGLWVTDFGSATDYSILSSSLTDNGERGTPKYFSPEVARWDPSRSASDIFAMGCVFFEIFTLCMGYSLETTQTLRARGDRSFQANLDSITHWFDNDEDLSRRPADEHLIGLIRHMMKPEPKDRPKASQVEEQIALIGEIAKATGESEFSLYVEGLSCSC